MADKDYYFDRPGTTWRRPLVVVLQATFNSGVATVDAANSDPDITLTKDEGADAIGDYDLAGLPRGKRIHFVGGGIDLGSDTPAGRVALGYVQPRSLNAAAGTGKLLFFNRSNGNQSDPPNGARLYLTLLIEAG